MEINYSKRFIKNYKQRIKKGSKLDKKFISRLNLFIKNPRNPILKNHKLVGKYSGYHAFSLTGDYRVVYKIRNNSIELYDVGTHNQVY